MPITFKRTVTKPEFFLLSVKNPRLWRRIAICILSFLVAYLLQHKNPADLPKAIQTIALILTISVGIITFVLALRLLLTIVLWLTLKQFSGIFLPQTFTFNSDGMLLENSAGGSVAREWTGFASWKRSKGKYLLKLLPAGVISIKRSDIPADQIKAFETLLETNLGVSAK